MKIELEFIGADDEDLEGYNYHHYFRDDALRRAQTACSVDEARSILTASYLGQDIYGVGVMWEVTG